MYYFLSILYLSFYQITVAQNFGSCITPTKSQGLCQPIKSCNSLFALLQTTPLTTTIRDFLRESQCGYQDKQIMVCCPDSLSRNILADPEIKCGVTTTNRITGGTSTAIDDFPWMALLEYSKPNNKKGFHCGGVLIHKRYVLTASHCVNGRDLPTTWKLSSVRLGEWDLSTNVDCEKLETGEECSDPVVDIPVIQIIPHEEFDPLSRNKANDIALLRLESPVTYTYFVQPICLPLSEQLKSFNFDGIALHIAGWGKTETGSQSKLKLKATVDGVGINKCYQTYNAESIFLTNKQMCAGGENGIDSCRGDSGGPLMGVYNNKTQSYWYLAGLTSFGPSPCGQEGWPGVYTRVGSYIDWIQKNIRP